MAGASIPQWVPTIAAATLALGASCNVMENLGEYEYLSAANGWSGATRFDDRNADVRFDIAATSFTVSRDPAENRARMKDLVEEIVDERPGVDVILFGETITGWYRRSADDEENRAYQRSVAEPIPGPTTDQMASLARQHRVFIAFGIAEAAEEGLYNSLVLLDRDGELLAVHRKFLTVKSDVVTSLDDPYENGPGATVANIEGVPFGLIICNDMHARTIAEGLAEARVKVVLSALADSVAAVEVDGFNPIGPLYNAWVVHANRFGTEADLVYPGAASIIDPAGAVRASLNGEGWIALDLGVFQ